ncbi:MAG: DUF4249 family protein [Flavobacteriales bacterium]|nr:DUF4249 family protein [Flavobacteriales bacterium]
MKRLLPLFAIALLAGCEKEITVDLPDTPEQLVVEGTIEPGLPPFVILTRTQSYFEPLDLTSIATVSYATRWVRSITATDPFNSNIRSAVAPI